MGRAFALHAANPGLIPGTHMPNRSEPECRGRNKSWAPPGVSPAPLKKKKKKEKEMSRCVTNERCLPVDLKLIEIMSPISLCPCFSSNFLLQPFLPTICYPLLVAVLTVPMNLSSHQNNHFWDCDDEDKIVCSLYPSMKLPLCQMQLCEAFKINFLVYEMTHSLISW